MRYTVPMPDQDLQSFYNDRRRRGLSDQIIFNELEASGWPKEGLQERLAAARQAYEKLPTAEYMADGDAIAYDVPQFMKARGITRFLYAGASIAVYVYFTLQETHDWLVASITLGIFAVIVLVTTGRHWLKQREQVRRIRFDSQGFTIQQPAGQLQAWTSFVGYRAGHRNLNEDEQQPPPTAVSLFTFWKVKPPTRPILQLYWVRRWVGMKSKELAYTLPLPPGREAAVVALVSKYLPPLSSNETSNATALGWKIFIFGMGFIALFLIGAIILVLA